jgi:uncharacterized protein (DUF58 family)
MSAFLKFLRRSSFYLNRVTYYIPLGIAVLFIFSYYISFLFDVALALLIFIFLAILIDTLLLYSRNPGITAKREVADRLSNGDDNHIRIEIENNYGFKAQLKVIDDLPPQFQDRNWYRDITINSGSIAIVDYSLKPLQRGEYNFGAINIYAQSPLRLVIRRYTIDQDETVKVYPSYIQMRRYQLLAATNKLQESGAQRLRKLGQSMEFEQIKEYVRGDDYRNINWKATARKGGDLMVNNFTDERSQQIYCVINKGRTMKMPFEGMTLLDYAINATLVISNTALIKQDKAGLITFAENLDTFLPADKKPTQMNLLLEQLYRQQTAFLEPDLEKLFSVIRNRITQRGLILLFTNYESFESLERELPSLKRIAHYHLLVVIFFENTELKQLIEGKAVTTEDIYIKTIAEKYSFEKKLIVKELQKNGILSVLTTPEKLTINALNKYLEIKNRQSL